MSLCRSQWFRVARFALIGLGVACGNTRSGDASYSEITQLQVLDAAFVSANVGTEIKVAGTSPSGKLSLVRVSLFDKSGSPVEVDTNDDGKVDSSSIDLPVVQSVDSVEFFVELPLAQSCSSTVSRVGIRVVDPLGAESDVKYANLDDLPQLQRGAPCDPRGFDKCPAETACTEVAGEWQAHCMSATAP